MSMQSSCSYAKATGPRTARFLSGPATPPAKGPRRSLTRADMHRGPRLALDVDLSQCSYRELADRQRSFL